MVAAVLPDRYRIQSVPFPDSGFLSFRPDWVTSTLLNQAVIAANPTAARSEALHFPPRRQTPRRTCARETNRQIAETESSFRSHLATAISRQDRRLPRLLPTRAR